MSPSNKQAARALADAPKIVSATVALMEELARVLIEEIDIVTKRMVKEHPELLKVKQKLAMSYRINIKTIAAQPDLLKKLSAEAKEAVRDASQMLARAAADNARILRTAVNASQQLLQNIMSMIKSEVLSKQPYKNAAKAHLQLGNYSPTCPPVAVSRSV